MNKKKVIVYGAGELAKESIVWVNKSPKHILVGYTFTPGQTDKINYKNFIPINSLHQFDDCFILIASEEWREIRRFLNYILAIPASRIIIYGRNLISSRLTKALINVVKRLPPFLTVSGMRFLRLTLGILKRCKEYKIYSIQSTYSDRISSSLRFYDSGVALIAPTIILETNTNIAYLSQPNANRAGLILFHRNISLIKNSKILVNNYKIDEAILAGILISSYAPDNLYHCVIELCPQLYFIRAEKEIEDMAIYVPGAVRYIPHWNFILEKLNLMARIKYLDTDKCYNFKKLYVSHSSNQLVTNAALPMTKEDHFIDRDKWVEYRLWLRESFLQSRVPSTSGRANSKIYAARHSRVAANTMELEALLFKRGFRFLYPEKHDVVEQAEIFSSANIIVGFSGAALTNLIFTNPSVHCLVFLPEGVKDVEVWSPLMDDCGNLTIQTYKSSARTSLELHTEKFSIDVSRVELWLNARNG